MSVTVNSDTIDIYEQTIDYHFLGFSTFVDSVSLQILQVLSFDPVIIVSPS